MSRVRSKVARGEGSAGYSVWERTPSDGSPDGPTYYDRPVLKEPVWIWAVPAYFYVGGAAGAAAVLGAAAQMLGDERCEGLVTKCRRIAAAGTIAGSGLLVYDLGRPERFINMLRVFRPTSALNMGSWVLAAAASFSSASVIFPVSHRPTRALGNASGLAAGIMGLPLTGYTAVLLSDTAVPLWQRTRRSMPWLFVAAAVTGATSLLEATPLTESEEKIVHRLGLMGKIAELIAMAAVERDAREVEAVGRPLGEGVGADLWRTARTATIAGTALAVLPRMSGAKKLIAAALGMTAGMALRFAVWQAGRQSARDPRATFASQREGAAATGRANVSP